jgi:hypothetical protein
MKERFFSFSVQCEAPNIVGATICFMNLVGCILDNRAISFTFVGIFNDSFTKITEATDWKPCYFC